MSWHNAFLPGHHQCLSLLFLEYRQYKYGLPSSKFSKSSFADWISCKEIIYVDHSSEYHLENHTNFLWPNQRNFGTEDFLFLCWTHIKRKMHSDGRNIASNATSSEYLSDTRISKLFSHAYQEGNIWKRIFLTTCQLTFYCFWELNDLQCLGITCVIKLKDNCAMV